MNSKKLFASVIAMAMAVTVVPGLSQAETATATDLAAQIQQLQAQLAGLQGQLGNETTSTGTPGSGLTTTNYPACAGVTFTRNLTLGSTGNDVKCLQQILNANPTFQVAFEGVGSAGNETTYFGGLTKNAVVKFQDTYAAEILTPVGLTGGTGFVGASTRVKLNAMLSAGPVIVTPTGNGCTGTTGYSTTTGLPCSTSTTLPEGCTSTTGYSPVTGQACTGTTTTGSGVTQTGAEGTITVTVNPSPADNKKVYEGDVKTDLYGMKIKATGSDVDVQRVTLKFTKQPYTYFSNIYLYDGDTQVATAALNSSTVSKVTASDYEITITGFSSKFIVANNTTKVMTVKADVNTGISSGAWVTGTTANTIVVSNPGTTSVRGVDQAGLNQYGGTTTGRTISINSSESTSATLSVSTNNSTPKAHNVIADASHKIVGATLLSFDMKATKDNLIVDSIDDVTFTTSAGYAIPETVYLVDDAGNVIGTDSPNTDATDAITDGTADFSDLNYTIAKDTTKTFTIKIDDTIATAVAATHVSTEDTQKYKVTVYGDTGTAQVNFIKSNGLTGTGTTSSSAASNDLIAFDEGPVFTLASISTTSTQPDAGSASSTISSTFNITVAATHGDIYITKKATANAFTIDYAIEGIDQGAATSVVYNQPSNTTLVSNSYKVAEGTTASFAITATWANSGTVGNYDLRVASITWGHLAENDASYAAKTSTYMNGLSEWIGQSVYLK
ncbi:MAG: hypothetical protein WCX69_00695 [Candidatus Paceibacterota bacterium]